MAKGLPRRTKARQDRARKSAILFQRYNAALNKKAEKHRRVSVAPALKANRSRAASRQKRRRPSTEMKIAIAAIVIGVLLSAVASFVAQR